MPQFIPEKHVPLSLVLFLSGRFSSAAKCISMTLAGSLPRMLKRPEEGGMSFADFLRQGVVEWVPWLGMMLFGWRMMEGTHRFPILSDPRRS